MEDCRICSLHGRFIPCAGNTPRPGVRRQHQPPVRARPPAAAQAPGHRRGQHRDGRRAVGRARILVLAALIVSGRWPPTRSSPSSGEPWGCANSPGPRTGGRSDANGKTGPGGAPGHPTPPPRVSIVIWARDRLVLRARAVRIVLAQDFTDYEIVIVDEGSEHKPQAAIADVLEPRNPLLMAARPTPVSAPGGARGDRGARVDEGDEITGTATSSSRPIYDNFTLAIAQAKVQRELQVVVWSTAAAAPAVVSQPRETMTTEARTLITFSPNPMIKFTGIRRHNGLHQSPASELPLRLPQHPDGPIVEPHRDLWRPIIQIHVAVTGVDNRVGSPCRRHDDWDRRSMNDRRRSDDLIRACSISPRPKTPYFDSVRVRFDDGVSAVSDSGPIRSSSG